MHIPGYARTLAVVSPPSGPSTDLTAFVRSTMTAVDKLWYMADESSQRAEQTYHRLADTYDDFLEYERTRHVSRDRFRTIVERIRANGLPYGAHSLVYRPSGELLLVRHDGVDMWVVPGGEVQGDEDFVEAARRELREEAGVTVDIEGMGILARVTFLTEGHSTWGVLPVFEGRAESTDLEVRDPDDEISAARWFEDLPSDTRDRAELQEWCERRL
jgi:ADP-ribose pyrophosphatase YjhB (NUDIX family)